MRAWTSRLGVVGPIVALATACGAYQDRPGTQRGQDEPVPTAPRADQVQGADRDPGSALPSTAPAREGTFGPNPIAPAIALGLLVQAAAVLGVVTLRGGLRDVRDRRPWLLSRCSARRQVAVRARPARGRRITPPTEEERHQRPAAADGRAAGP